MLLDRYGDYTAPYGVQVKKDTYEDGATERGIGSLPNHTDHAHANAELYTTHQPTSQVRVRAIRPIRNTDEILLDYGNEYHLHEEGVSYSTNRNRHKI